MTRSFEGASRDLRRGNRPGAWTLKLRPARASKLSRFFAQPLFCAEPYTRRPGVTVSVTDALRGCREILDGVHDGVPEQAFYFTGGI
jgi:F-type H+/Na+-transporting ATPase subunit beta